MNENKETTINRLRERIVSQQKDIRKLSKIAWISAVLWCVLAAFNIAHLVMEHLR